MASFIDGAGRITVHIVDDNDAMRETAVRGFVLQGVPAVGYPTGEAFLAQWKPDMRGVICLDLQLMPRGQINGDQVFDRLMALRSHLPVVIHTGPYGHHVQLAARLVRQRDYVDYFGRDQPSEDVEARILDFLADEPILYTQALKERALLQWLLVDVTHGERIAIEGPLTGIKAQDLATEVGITSGVVRLHVHKALERLYERQASPSSKLRTPKPPYAILFDRHKAPGDPIAHLAMMLAPLMKHMGATGHGNRGRIVHLAALELSYRLRLLDEAQQRALQAALKAPKHQPASIGHDQRDEALALISVDDVATLKSLLKIAGQEMLGYMRPQLSDPRHRWALNWIDWIAVQPPRSDWAGLTDPLDA